MSVIEGALGSAAGVVVEDVEELERVVFVERVMRRKRSFNAIMNYLLVSLLLIGFYCSRFRSRCCEAIARRRLKLVI